MSLGEVRIPDVSWIVRSCVSLQHLSNVSLCAHGHFLLVDTHQHNPEKIWDPRLSVYIYIYCSA